VPEVKEQNGARCHGGIERISDGPRGESGEKNSGQSEGKEPKVLERLFVKE